MLRKRARMLRAEENRFIFQIAAVLSSAVVFLLSCAVMYGNRSKQNEKSSISRKIESIGVGSNVNQISLNREKLLKMSHLGGKESKSTLNEELARIISEVDRLEASAEPTNSKAVQESVKFNIDALEKLTRWVSQVAMFSENEDVSELPADSLRFLLLPAVLGTLTGKVLDEDRLEILQREQAYYQDFLRRLQSYNIIERKQDGANANGGKPSTGPHSDLFDQAKTRQAKIERYKEQQTLQTKLQTLRQRVQQGATVDDDLARDLYLTELKLWARKIADASEAAEQELEMLRMRSRVKGEPTTSSSAGATEKRAQPSKPFIITRTELQKAVYGLGYPSIPTMSLEEFFEQKRHEGQIQLLEGGEKPRGPVTEEDEKIMREEQEEREASEVVQHDREYDEYKDDHRRGWGNVHNKG